MKKTPKNLVTMTSAAMPVIWEYASDTTVRYVHLAHQSGPPPRPTAKPAGIIV